MLLAFVTAACLAIVVIAQAQTRTPKISGNWHKMGQNISAGWRKADARRKKKKFEAAAKTYRQVVEYIQREEVGRIGHQVVSENMIKLCQAMPLDVKKLSPGVYHATSRGYQGNVSVAVKISKGRIKGLKITEQVETRPRKAMQIVPRLIVRRQSPSVDAATGATVSSYAVMCATLDALQKAEKADAED